MAWPYILVLIIMTMFVTPYIRRQDRHSVFSQNKGLVVTSDMLWLVVAYLVYIFFSVYKDYGPYSGANDAYAYYLNFLKADCSLRDFLFNVTTVEPGYSFVIWVIRHLTDDYHWVLWFWHTLTFFLSIYYCRHVYLNKYSFFSIFMLFFALINQFNTVRMSISVSIALCSLIAMSKRHWKRAILICLIALSIHISAFIMFPVIFVVLIVQNVAKYKKVTLIMMVIAGIGVACISLGVIEKIVSSTGDKVYLGYSSLALGSYFAVLIFSCLALNKYRDLVNLHSVNQVLILALPVCLVCIPLQLRISILYRCIQYFLPIIFSLIPSILKCYAQKSSICQKVFAYSVVSGYIFFRIVSFCRNDLIPVGEYVNTLL